MDRKDRKDPSKDRRKNIDLSGMGRYAMPDMDMGFPGGVEGDRQGRSGRMVERERLLDKPTPKDEILPFYDLDVHSIPTEQEAK